MTIKHSTSTICKLCILLILIIGLNSCGGSSKKNTNETPTSFETCEELVAYTKFFHYSDLVKRWGEGSIGEPWDASGVGKFEMKVNVTWPNIKCKGKPVTIMFVNSYYSTESTFKKNPVNVDGVYCDEKK